MKRVGIAVFVGLLFVGPSYSQQSDDDKRCIFAAAQHLPKIPGLSIVATRITKAPQEASKVIPEAVAVEIDIRAAAQDATFAFVCALLPGVPPFIHPISR